LSLSIGQSTTRQAWSIDQRRCLATSSGWVKVRLRDVLRALVHRPSLPASRRAKPAPVVYLQSVHEEGFGDRAQGGDRGADRGPGRGADATHPSPQAGVAPSGSRRNRSPLGLILQNQQSIGCHHVVRYGETEPLLCPLLALVNVIVLRVRRSHGFSPTHEHVISPHHDHEARASFGTTGTERSGGTFGTGACTS
jgi:hypothetical protein